MTDREKLIALMDAARDFADGECDKMEGCSCCPNDILAQHCQNPAIADHLLANGVVVREWIPVTERLPGTEKVLITDGDIVMRGYRRPDGVWKYGVETHEVWENMSLRPVTHWMPFPEPPKEGE